MTASVSWEAFPCRVVYHVNDCHVQMAYPRQFFQIQWMASQILTVCALADGGIMVFSDTRY